MRFGTWMAEQRYSPSTVRNYVRMVERAQGWLDDHGGPALKRATWEHLEPFTESLPPTGSSRGQCRAALIAYWRFLGKHERDCPAWRMTVPSRPPPLPNPMEEEELERVFATARHLGPRFYAVSCCLYYLGIRRAELARLRWSAIRGGWVRVLGKGAKERLLPFHQEVANALAELPREGDYVFPGRWGGHICEGTVNLWVTMISETAEVDLHPHRFRHTCLTNGLEATQDLAAVQEYAGHTRPETTRRYTRVHRQRLEGVSGAL